MVHTHTMSEVIDIDTNTVYIDCDRTPPRKRRCPVCGKWILETRMSAHNLKEHLTVQGTNVTGTSGTK